MTDSRNVDFAIRLNALRNALHDRERARARLGETSAAVEALLVDLQAHCPHADVTECPGDDDAGTTTIGNTLIPQRFRNKTRRRCETCGLFAGPGGRLDGVTPARTMSQSAFAASDPYQ